MNSKINVYRKSLKENALPEKAKILKELNKITGKQLKSFTSCPGIPRGAVKKSVVEVRHELPRRDIERLSKAFRSVGSQTALGAQNEYEGVVRYPSSRRVELRPQREVGLQVGSESSPRGCGDSSNSYDLPINHVRMNQIPMIKPKVLPSSKKIDPCRAPPSYQKGIIPKYLQKLKEDDQIEDWKIRKSVSCNVKVKDKDLEEKEEKLKKLAFWHDSYKQMVSELNVLSAAS